MEKELIERLEQFLAQKDWSRAEFARQMDLFPQQVGRFFNGTADIQKIFLKLKQKGCDLNWLATGEESKQNVDTQINTITIYEPMKIENQLTESVSQNPGTDERNRIAELEMRIVELEAENRVLEATMDKLIAAKSRGNAQAVVDYPDLLNRQPRLRAAEPVAPFSGGKRDDTE